MYVTCYYYKAIIKTFVTDGAPSATDHTLNRNEKGGFDPPQTPSSPPYNMFISFVIGKY